MATLYAFLHPEPIEKTKDVIISTRFKDENGKVIPFTIKNITQEENTALNKKCKRVDTIKGVRMESFDNIKYTNLLVVACTANPDFREADICEAYHTMDPLDVPSRMLTAGEFTKLTQEIMDLNDFDDVDSLEDDAKN